MLQRGYQKMKQQKLDILYLTNTSTQPVQPVAHQLLPSVIFSRMEMHILSSSIFLPSQKSFSPSLVSSLTCFSLYPEDTTNTFMAVSFTASAVLSQSSGDSFLLTRNFISYSLTQFSGWSKDMHGVRLSGDSELAIGMNVSVNGCLSLCISPVTDW